MNILRNIKKVAVGISGGVDSAVAALLLKRKGYEVVGVFMKNWDLTDENGYCSTEADLDDACFVCQKLNIPFHEVNFVKPYWNQVFEELISDYQNGLTPNPDILCNKYIKFKRFCDHATDRLGCDFIATGHYARRSFPETDSSSSAVRLLKAKDPDKDQTFFLCQIPQNSLQKTLFPLGDFMKSEVKKIAAENGLEKIAKKKESMGMCFIGNRHFPSFIEDYVAAKEGVFIDIDSGKIVGRHTGKHQFTIGQGCKLAGFVEKVYVARKNENEDIYVAMGHEHPVFYGRHVFTSPAHWIRTEPHELARGSFLSCQFRFQHRNPLINCIAFQTSIE
uniref:tRNA-5-taurinomethyluridine 2-sulfurtransferase n=1 Tax=Lygus hesperus TaxID=30085 RepID=A0A0K8T8H0_LYGHE